jgi:hypothetical protein
MKSEIKQLKEFLENETKRRIEELGTFKGYNIHEVRIALIEDRYFSNISLPDLFSGEDTGLDTMLGSLDINIKLDSGGWRHLVGNSPSFVLSNISVRYDHNKKEFILNSMEIK